LWHSTTTWNSTTDITSRGQANPGISFVRNGDLIHRGIQQNGTSYMAPYASVYQSPQLHRIQTDNDRLFIPFTFSGSINGVYSQVNTYFLGEYDYTGNLSPPILHLSTHAGNDILLTQNTTIKTTIPYLYCIPSSRIPNWATKPITSTCINCLLTRQ
jgi:hypothetical protein